MLQTRRGGILAAVVLCLGGSLRAGGGSPDTRCFELRTYYARPGKMEDLHARFRDHALPLFAQHGMTSIGYWVPLENPDEKLIYLLAFPSREARDQAWKAFMNDSEWVKAYQASETNGRLVVKVENLFLQATDYSPEIKPAIASPARVFELRAYRAASNRLDALQARFRDHAVRLFQKHAIQQIGYWIPMTDQTGAGNTLIHLLAHPSKDAAAAAFGEFQQDPEWIAARKESEERAGGPLTATNGVASLFLEPTDYSPLK